MNDKIEESTEFEKWRNEQIASLQRMGYPDAAKAFRNHGSLHWAGWQARAALAAAPATAVAQESVEVHLVLAEEEYEAPTVLRAFSDRSEAETFAQALRDYQRTRPEWPVGDADLEEVEESEEKTRAWVSAHPGGEDAASRRFFSVIAVPFSAAPPCAAQDGDAQIDAMRRSGLSIDGDNAYKRDLIDCIVGALTLGKQGVNPPPAGHWLEQFWQMARGEGEIQEQMAERVLASNDGERKTLAERMRDKFHHEKISPEIVRKLKEEEKSVMGMVASSPDGKGSQEMHDALDVLRGYLLMCRLQAEAAEQEGAVMAPRDLLAEAESIIESYAEALKASHAPGGDWDGEEAAHDEYELEAGVASKLRALLAGGAE